MSLCCPRILSAASFGSIFLLAFACTSLAIGQNAGKFPAHDVHSHSMRPRLAPEWKLENIDGKFRSHRSFKGKPHVILLTLGTDCLHCAEQIQSFRDCHEEFQRRGVKLISIHAQSLSSLKEATQNLGDDSRIEFLADPNGEAFRAFLAYDPFREKMLHSTVLVDSFGKIRWQHLGDHPFVNHRMLIVQIDRIRQEQDPVDRPKVFLDKNPRIVAYQLGRLNNERLLLVERKTDHKKYVPVFEAILSRDAMSPQYRDEAVDALVKLNQSDPATEIMKVISKCKTDSRQSRQTANEIAAMLLRLPPRLLRERKDDFVEAIDSENAFIQRVGFAALLTAGFEADAWQSTRNDPAAAIACLNSIELVADQNIRNRQREHVLASLNESRDIAERAAAVSALGEITVQPGPTFVMVAKLIENPKLRSAVVSTLGKVPPPKRDAKTCELIIASLVEMAEKTPAEKRTTDDFLDAMQLVDQLMISIPVAKRGEFRQRLSRVTVRVVKIRTLEDEMRYDVPFFAVEAGKPVQIVLENVDMMAHNLVVTQPGFMKQVAETGGVAGPAKDYLPEDRGKILYATKMIPSEHRTLLTFDAPEKPGEYPYVCTFPQHWSRMYGVMVVVEDLDDWLKNPVKPKDPIGNTRRFVKSWTINDFKDIEKGLVGRNIEIGARIYKEANCAQCHELAGDGAKVGPELDTVFARHKNGLQNIVREVLDPSYRIDDKYSMHSFLTFDGETVTGMIKSENDDEIRLLDNPDSKELITLKVEDIDERVKTSKSIMPKGLLDQFTEDEILELIAYLKSKQKKAEK